MDKYSKLFDQIGIDQKSGKIYTILLEFGRQSISEISKMSLVQRVDIYRKLPYLIESGMVVEVKIGKRKFYKASSPKVLQDLMNQNQDTSKVLISDMFERFRYSDSRPSVVYQEGKQSITRVFSDIVNSLNTGDIFYRISSETDVSKSNSYLPNDYRKKRDSKNLERYVITTQNTNKQKISRLERESVIFPEEYEQFDENIQMIIYANKIAYVDYNTETATTIENDKIARFQKKLFKALFKSIGK